jgi:hypothetical protein
MKVQIEVEGSVIDCEIAMQLCSLFDQDTLGNFDCMNDSIMQGLTLWLETFCDKVEDWEISEERAATLIPRLQRTAALLQARLQDASFE